MVLFKVKHKMLKLATIGLLRATVTLMWPLYLANCHLSQIIVYVFFFPGFFRKHKMFNQKGHFWDSYKLKKNVLGDFLRRC